MTLINLGPVKAHCAVHEYREGEGGANKANVSQPRSHIEAVSETSLRALSSFGQKRLKLVFLMVIIPEADGC